MTRRALARFRQVVRHYPCKSPSTMTPFALHAPLSTMGDTALECAVY